MRIFKRPISCCLAALISIPVLAVEALPPPEATNEKAFEEEVTKIPRRIRVGNTVVVIRHPTLETGVVEDQDGTLYLLTLLATGHKELLRVSKKAGVKKLIMFNGWPYILDRKGRLYALDISWKTTVWTKAPAAIRRIPLAVGAGFGIWLVSFLNNWAQGTESAATSVSPETLGIMGGTAFLFVDALVTMTVRNYRKLKQDGGNFFNTQIAKGVLDVIPVENGEDYLIRFRHGSVQDETKLHLSDLAPKYTEQASCVYQLTKLTLQ